MNVSKDFTLDEFLPPDVYERFPATGIWFLDPRILVIAQFIRDRYGKPVTINDYLGGGRFMNRGFRHPQSSVGAILGQHKFGRAIDFNVEGMPSEEVGKDVKDNYPAFKAVGVTTLEVNTPGWTHLDCRYTGKDSLFIVKPN